MTESRLGHLLSKIILGVESHAEERAYRVDIAVFAKYTLLPTSIRLDEMHPRLGPETNREAP